MGPWVKDKTVMREFWFICRDFLPWPCTTAQTEALRSILNAPSALTWQVWVHLSLQRAVWFLPRHYMVYLAPHLTFGKGRRYDSQSGSSTELASAPSERSAAELRHVRRYVLGERIHFLVKPSTFAGIWRRLRIFSCLSYFFFLPLFTLRPCPLLHHVPGLYTALWSDYSSSGLITVNEGLRTGLSQLDTSPLHETICPVVGFSARQLRNHWTER